MHGPWNIAVLMGGTSAEREISLDSGKAVSAALQSRGHHVTAVDFDDPLRDVAQPVVQNADVVFVALHGGTGEGGQVQAVLELAGLPYVGSGPEASAVAMDKIWSKRIVAQLGFGTPEWTDWSGPTATSAQIREAAASLTYPVVLKPAAEGSSVGVVIAAGEDELMAGWNQIGGPGSWMMERFVAGREVTVSMLAGEALPVIEIRPLQGFYDFQNKYTKGRCEYDCPAQLNPSVAATAQRQAVRIYEALRLRDFARLDFRLDEAEELWFLEANTIPGMTDLSLVPMAAAEVGIDFPELCHRLCAMAVERGATRGSRC